MRDDIPLADCLKWLKRNKHSTDKPPLVAVLIQQLINFKTNPAGMREPISRTMEAIKGRSA